jgi:hypothetical protein
VKKIQLREVIFNLCNTQDTGTYIKGTSNVRDSILSYFVGRGNAAFETADSIYGATGMIHMVGRSRVRLSWSTHYVGDLR